MLQSRCFMLKCFSLASAGDRTPLDLLRNCDRSRFNKIKNQFNKMNYEQLQKLNSADFKRYCGVHQETFKEMVKIVKADKILQKQSGGPSKLFRDNQILMTLSYL
jgi:hypothetical protein